MTAVFQTGSAHHPRRDVGISQLNGFFGQLNTLKFVCRKLKQKLSDVLGGALEFKV